ncbi:MAG: WecB/TagA/CpsF family glycosyltransferase [Clostridiales bacterium]|nr:WecB/TagA/CpsF family glycosyltransferase [Clostridiales bacterium]
MQSQADPLAERVLTSLPTSFPTVDVLGFPVANLDMGEAVAAIRAMLERQGSTREAGGAARIVTANAEIMYHADQDPSLGMLLRTADLILPDGVGVVKAASILGSPLKERVAGTDLMVELAAWAEANGRSVYLLGAAKESVEGAAAALREKYPALRIAGYHDGYFKGEETEAILMEIEAARPDFLFIGMGFPAQDRFYVQHKGRLPVGVVMGVGGSFDALSGKVRRAPLWVRRLNLEWAFRFAQNPKRLGRIWALPGFVLAVLLKKAKKRD